MSKEINVKHHLKESEQKRTGTEENGGGICICVMKITGIIRST